MFRSESASNPFSLNTLTFQWRHFSRQGKPLGRAERKWLSHYDLPSDEYIDYPEATEQSSPVSSLEDALVNADCLLEAAMVDQRSISQALKMNDASIASQNDLDMLEELRWYVHPKECASYLSQGLSSVPGTESPELLGGIQPVDAQKGEKMGVTSAVEVETADVAMTEASIADKKRKQSNAQSCCSVMGEDHNNTLMASAHISDDERFSFRDANHAGEASFSEIAAGFEDEELSGNCEIFDPQTDAWIGIESFLRTRKKTKTNSSNGTKNSPAPAQVVPAAAAEETYFFRDGEHVGEALLTEIESGFDDEELSKGCEVFDPKADLWLGIEEFLQTYKGMKGKVETSDKKTATTVSQIVPVHDKKNEKKKPARRNTAWGRGNFVPPTVSPNVTETSNAAAGSVQSKGKAQSVSENLSAPGAASKKKKFKHIKPPAKLMRLVTQAIIQWDMIQEGDRLLLGLSGGKDSLSLLHCLLETKRKIPTNFEIEVCTIDPMTPSFDPSPLIPYVESLGLKYHYIRDDIVERANSAGKDGKTVSSLCAFCARMKRGNLYTCARKNNCNKLVLAQHLDDCAESFMMSVMHNGFLRTMKANYQINAGDLSVIRPLVYCRESLMTEFAKSAQLPIINENCKRCFSVLLDGFLSIVRFMLTIFHTLLTP